MRRIPALILIILLVATSACTQDMTVSPGENEKGRVIAAHTVTGVSDGVTPTVGKTPEGGVPDLSPHWLCDEKTTLTVCTYDAVNNTYLPPSNDEWFWQMLEDYTNVHIEWNIHPNAGYDEIVNTRLAAGVNLSDIMMNTGVKTTQNAGYNGTYIDLKPYWDNCFPNTKAYFENLGTDIIPFIENQDGSIYALPNTINPTEGHITFMYNTAWLKELGAEVPTTLDGFTDLLYKMQRAGDLNHNGFNDEVILTSSSISILMSVLGNAFNLEQYEGWEAFGADEEGNVYAEYTTDNMRECIRYFGKLYADGILDNDIFYMNADEMGEKIAQDRVGCFVYYSGFSIGYGKLTPAGQANPLRECFTLGLPLDSEWNGNAGYFVYRTFAYGNTGAAITKECRDPELAAKWLDVMYADPNILWARVYGKEGETYQVNKETNEIELIYDENGEWNTKALGIGQLSLPFIQTTEELLNDKLPYEWYLNEYDEMRKCRWVKATVPKVTIFTEEENDLRDAVNSEVTAYWFEWRDKFISGQSDIETEWDTYVNSINRIGLKQMVQAWQMVYDRTK